VKADSHSDSTKHQRNERRERIPEHCEVCDGGAEHRGRENRGPETPRRSGQQEHSPRDLYPPRRDAEPLTETDAREDPHPLGIRTSIELVDSDAHEEQSDADPHHPEFRIPSRARMIHDYSRNGYSRYAHCGNSRQSLDAHRPVIDASAW
jgi:hypothetical protein